MTLELTALKQRFIISQDSVDLLGGFDSDVVSHSQSCGCLYSADFWFRKSKKTPPTCLGS